MKTIFLLGLVTLSFNLFAKGGGQAPTERCESTRQQVLEKIADSYNKYITYDIKWYSRTDELKIDYSDIVRTMVVEHPQTGKELGSINIVHTIEKGDIGDFLTQIAFRSISFHKEEEIDGVIYCVWKPDLADLMKTYKIDGDRYRFVSGGGGGHGKVKIPLL